LFLLGFTLSALCLSVPLQSGDVFSTLGEGAGLTSADYFDPEEYLVGFGDQIWLSFPGGVPFASSTESASTLVLPVGLDGRLSVPGFAPIDVDGLNLAQLNNVIEEMFFSSYGRFAVASGLARSASFEMPVTGQVNEPGMITVNGLTRLSEAIDEAGGTTANAAVSNILVVSLSEDSSRYDLNDFLMNGQLPSNPLMRRNTRIHVFSAEASIVIEGALSVAGYEPSIQTTHTVSDPPVPERVVLEFIQGETPQEALQRAGGASELANLENCFVQRSDGEWPDESIPFDLQMDSGEFQLTPGDRIVIPFSERFINVVGQVRNPVPIVYSPGMNVNYYIGMAGGFTPSARESALKVIHSDGVKEDVELTYIVPPGSTVEVPRVAVQFWQEYLTILTGVATVVISYQSLFSN